MDAAFYESLPGAGMYVWRFLDTKFEGLPMSEPESTRDGQYVICPYCGDQRGDCWEWVDETVRQDKCPNCGKEYQYWAEMSIDYIAQPLAPIETKEK